jgi:hypothetical protein
MQEGMRVFFPSEREKGGIGSYTLLYIKGLFYKGTIFELLFSNYLFVGTEHLFVGTEHLFVGTEHLFVGTEHLFVGTQDLCVQSNKTGNNKTIH